MTGPAGAMAATTRQRHAAMPQQRMTPRLYTLSQRYNAVLDFFVFPLSGFYLVNQYRWGSQQSDQGNQQC